MGISSAMAAGVMGLNVNSSKLATISDNIANSETKGYKRASVEFGALVMEDRPTAYDAGGVRASTVRYIEDQGALVSTTNATDIAISGRGFLPVTDIADVNRSLNPPLKLTRTGSFAPDAQGVYRTASGLALLGWKADANGVFPSQRADLQPVKLDNLTLAAEPTTQIDVSLNLDAGANPGDPAFTFPLDFYDGIGANDTLDIALTRQAAANTWRLDVEQRSNPGVSLASYDVTFFDSLGAEPGKIASVAEAGGGPNLWNTSTGDLPITTTTGMLSLGLGAWGPVNAATGPTGFTQFASRSELRGATSDGSPASSVVGVDVGENGVMEAIFDTGFRQAIFKIPVANVQNPNGMRALDGPSYELTRDSGDVFFFEAGTGPTGRLVSNALEESTTDVAEELTSLIKTQRAYSSNAKIIQTVDEMLQETTNLKR